MQVVAVDTETDLIGPGNVVPKLICASMAFRPDPEGPIQSVLMSSAPEDKLEAFLDEMLDRQDILWVFLNAGFDITVFGRAYPRLIPKFFALLARGDACTDIGVREKLRNISTTGRLLSKELPDGTFEHVEYSLAALTMRYLGIDISTDKDESEDNWRYNYGSLLGVPARAYPAEAAAYAKSDAEHTLGVWEAQEALGAPERGPGSMHGQYDRTALQFALRLVTARGMVIDPVERERLNDWIAEELDDSRMELIVEAGILRPGVVSRPHKHEYKKLAEFAGCTHEAAKAAIDEQWSAEDISALVTAGIRCTGYTKPSINTKRLREAIAEIIAEINSRPDLGLEEPIKLRMTEPSGMHPQGQVSTSDAVLADLEPYSPVIAEYRHRQSLQQIANKELPAMAAPVVHFNYQETVSSFRTSSYGGGLKKLYPATNGQNVNPRVRKAYLPRPGNVLCSVDYDQLELRCFAQKCYSLFGHSAMRDRLIRGVDEHAYLGARLAARMCPEFAAAVKEIADDREKVYQAFVALKKSEDPAVVALYKLYRKLAKPTGLGYPGGLGPVKFVSFASSKAYNVVVDIATATMFREVWKDTNPEAQTYFDHISRECVDPFNAGSVNEETGRVMRKYCYTTPLGLYRAGCAFTESANGNALQSPAADGFMIAVFTAVRACYDWTMGSVLYGAHIVNIIHDEIIGEWEDDERSHDRAMELARIMIESMSIVIPDVPITATPALMRRWDKRAEAVYDDNKRLIPWEPPVEVIA